MLITTKAFFAGEHRVPKKRGANFPEVIIRKTCTFYEKQGKSYPIPELLLLANRTGFLWLSKVFARCARKTGEAMPAFARDPDDHEHLDQGDPQINPIHSDEFDFRLGILTRKNRRAVFKKYGIAQHKPFKGDLVSQYQRQITEVRSLWRRMRALDRRWKKENERENRRWKSVLGKLRGRQNRDLNQSANATPARARRIRRLFRGVAELEVGPGFRRPQNRGAPQPLPDGTARVTIYGFARTRRQASRRFADGLNSAGYRVTKISDVQSHGSHRPMPMDECCIRPNDLLRAWETEEVLYGWFC